MLDTCSGASGSARSITCATSTTRAAAAWKANPPMPDYIPEPQAILGHLRTIAAGLPEAYEEPAWAGIRWRIRKHTFAHVRTIAVGDGDETSLKFRLRGPER